jgi:hypothetical protein
MSRSRISLLCSLVLVLLALGCRGCPPSPPPPPPPLSNDNQRPGLSPTPTASKLASESTVTRVDANVKTGDGDPLTTLTDNAPHNLLPRARVITDPNGEALVELAGCMQYYLLQVGTMTFDSCSKSERKSGNASCLEGGTAIFNSECARRVEQLIQTPTEDIAPTGTWLVVTYLPEKQLTVTVVLKGSAAVTPVIDFETRSLGQTMTVKEGEYSLTMPDKRADSEDYDTSKFRQPKKLSEMPTELVKYLRPWLERIQKHAKRDELPRQSYAFTADVNCDCEQLEFGSRLPCIRGEAALWKRYYETGEMGKCDPDVRGPNARPK